jgi:cytochrome c oxidase cbb3-type subunit 3
MSDTGKLRVHDGIVEEDNRLPYWWLATFFATVFFGAGYWLYYEVTHTGLDPLGEYQADMAELRAHSPHKGSLDSAALEAMAKDVNAAAEGQKTFSTTCVACHGPKGEGLVGPNLTDKFWLHGGRPEDIYKTVSEGVPTKGMPAWGKTLSEDKVRSVVAFVLTLKGQNLPGKAPQGDAEP